MFFIVCALTAEARPLISALSLRRDDNACPYETYFAEDCSCVLCISGMGPVAASSATTYLLTRFGTKNETDFLINFGSCAGKDPGLHLIHKITDSTTGRDFYPDMLYDLSSCGLPSSSEKALVTVSKVVASLEDPNLLYEMEASGIFQAASRFLPPHRMLFLKYVSDQGVDDPKKITSAMLQEGAEKQTSTVLSVMKKLEEACKEEPSVDEDLFLSTALSLRLSETMRYELHQLFEYALTENIDIRPILDDFESQGRLPAGSKKEGKAVLYELRQRLI
ncbi:MAG: hypothetical protein J6T40_05275 [Clostridiales bacterium]|nr:hypothetical protein [Clostridiales bacterium]